VEPYLEHLNLTVIDVDRTVRFLQTAMPRLQVRGSGTGEKCRRWVHVGIGATYLAIEDRGAEGPGPHEPYVHPGMNHIGFVVSDVGEVAERLSSAGYRPGMKAQEHPHRKRIYFFDDDGNEFEFVEYLSAEPDERNDYRI
jgi:catechol 2,3-dioxygenase-like lactoylglutathione lyase family enzyme